MTEDFAAKVRAHVEEIAESLGISVSPLRGPSDQSGGGVRPRSGEPVVEVDDDPGWLDRDTEFDRTADAANRGDD